MVGVARARARVMRAALLAHRDSARIVAGNRPPESSLPGIERQLRALADAGVTPRDGLLALLALNAYVIGDVIDQQADETRQHPAPTKPLPAAEPPAGSVAPDGPYPLLRAAIGGMSSPDQRFEHGLGALIAGFRARHAG